MYRAFVAVAASRRETGITTLETKPDEMPCTGDSEPSSLGNAWVHTFDRFMEWRMADSEEVSLATAAHVSP